MLRRAGLSIVILALAGCGPQGAVTGARFALQAGGRGVLGAGDPGPAEPAEPAYADALGGYVGSVAAVAPLAALGQVNALAHRADGALWIAEAQAIRLMAPDADGRDVIVTVAGASGVAGHADGPGPDARFQGIAGIQPLPDGSLLVADQARIKRVVFGGPGGATVTTLAGGDAPIPPDVEYPPPPTVVDGDATQATFAWITGLTRTPDGMLWVSDAHRVRRIAYDPAAGTFQASTWFVDADAVADPENQRWIDHIAADAAGRVWISGVDGLRRLATTSGGACDRSVLGIEPSARAGDPANPYRFRGYGRLLGLPDGSLLFVEDAMLWRVTFEADSSPRVTLVARSIPFEPYVKRYHGALDTGLGGGGAMAVTAAGQIRIADGQIIRSVTPDADWKAVPENYAGFLFESAPRDGYARPEALHPLKVTSDGAGGWFMIQQNAIYHATIDANGAMTTSLVAGRRELGKLDGVGDQAAFDVPNGLLRLHDGSLLITDYMNSLIKRITLDGAGVGTATTWAGGGPSTFVVPAHTTGDGPALGAGLAPSDSLVEAPDGTVYFADRFRVRKAYRDAGGQLMIKTVAGRSGLGIEHAEGPGATARFGSVDGLALAPDGTLYVADGDNDLICQLTFDAAGDATVTRIAGAFQGPLWNHLPAGYQDGPALQARFHNIVDLDLEADGALLLTDAGNHAIRRLKRDAGGAWQVSTVIGGAPGFRDGTPDVARLFRPYDLVPDGPGRWLCSDGEYPSNQLRTIRLGVAP